MGRGTGHGRCPCLLWLSPALLATPRGLPSNPFPSRPPSLRSLGSPRHAPCLRRPPFIGIALASHLARPPGREQGPGRPPFGLSCPSPPCQPHLFSLFYLLLLWVAAPCPLPRLVPFLAFPLPPTLPGPLGVNKAQGALPLSSCAPPLTPLAPLRVLFFSVFLLPLTLLGPLGVNKAQGALTLGRRALSRLSASFWPSRRFPPTCFLTYLDSPHDLTFHSYVPEL